MRQLVCRPGALPEPGAGTNSYVSSSIVLPGSHVTTTKWVIKRECRRSNTYLVWLIPPLWAKSRRLFSFHMSHGSWSSKKTGRTLVMGDSHLHRITLYAGKHGRGSERMREEAKDTLFYFWCFFFKDSGVLICVMPCDLRAQCFWSLWGGLGQNRAAPYKSTALALWELHYQGTGQ